MTGIRFWEQRFEDKASRLHGFPTPKLDEDSLYWRNVNELAHVIAEYLKKGKTQPEQSAPAVLLAETTEELLDCRDSIVAFLRQQQYEVFPVSDCPRDSETAYVEALE